MRHVNAPRRLRRPGRPRRAPCWLASAALLLAGVMASTGVLPRLPAAAD